MVVGRWPQMTVRRSVRVSGSGLSGLLSGTTGTGAGLSLLGHVCNPKEDSDAHSGFGDFDDCDGFGSAGGRRCLRASTS
jgi:hypothetical protein